ncbi:PREDICTED: uncharacterized protein LOC105570817 [Vollenhovia emeryi]|uniref:uncharacterized protein LOC105570817 n=1 Tax=Vollenhovia emeryi TaxID=411798 RepID=UPI0005F4DB0D|nr:PREDICTED: uncharacterized protein LOC105570817 [Vollenhovia emeryi]
MFDSEETVNTSENDSIQSSSINDSSTNVSHKNDSNSAVLCNEEINSVSNIKSKIQQWTLDNLDTLQLNVVTDLLRILREEGHSSLPRTAQSLLGTKHHRILQQIKSNKNTQGEYIYIGIEHGLNHIINTQIFIEKEICILVHIDGVQIYNNSQIQVWPIIMKIFHKEYNCEPFTIALYCGDSKPGSAHDYLNDFVTEATKLINQGVTINTRTYSFRIIAIIADSPARSFIKCIKPPGAFYACERCSVKGISVGKELKKKRIYPETNCLKRTKESFEGRNQPQHHKDNVMSPLLLLPNFDIINDVLDSMHLLYLGTMKYLLENWTVKKSSARLKRRDINNFRRIILNVTADVPYEFQRKKFDVYLVSRCKATQFRFFLLYCGTVVLKSVLPDHHYRHFLLFSAACRILNSSDLSRTTCDYAKYLLTQFFRLLPSLYGESSQVLSMHNLIHVANDVINHNIPLSGISAFWGESYIGLFKKLVKSPNKPLTQIVNRLSELNSGNRLKIKKMYPFELYNR